MFQPHWVCPVQRCLCFPRLHCSGSRLLYMGRVLHLVWFQFSGTPQKCGFGCTCVLCLPRPERLRQPEAWAHSPRVRRAFSLCGPSARHRSGLRESSDRTRGLFAGWEGVASLGLSLPLSPPPASYLQRGWAGSSLEFLSPFVL